MSLCVTNIYCISMFKIIINMKYSNNYKYCNFCVYAVYAVHQSAGAAMLSLHSVAIGLFTTRSDSMFGPVCLDALYTFSGIIQS